jgi:tetratricopeptide (TPR) repeat protein
MAQLLTEILQECKDIQSGWEHDKNPEKIEKAKQKLDYLSNELPDDPNVEFQLGTYHLQTARYGGSIPYFKRCLAKWPNNAHVWSNLGCAYRSVHNIGSARECFRKSLGLMESGDTYSNMASTYINEGMPEEGLDYAIKSMELNPEAPKPKWNYSLLELETGNYEAGFKFYDAGFPAGERAMRDYHKSKENPEGTPWWNGEDFENKMVVFDEQGIGDRVMVMHSIHALEKYGDKIILETHPRLETLYRRAFPWVPEGQIYPTVKKPTIKWPPEYKIDYKISSYTLAAREWAKGNFNRTPYLTPNPELVEKYRKEYEALGDGPYITFSWTGGAPKTNTKYRSIKLGQFIPFIELGGTWISLQYQKDFAEAKVNSTRERTKLPIFQHPAAYETDFDHMLAALAAADLNLTANQSNVHLAGAANLPCWVLTPRRCAWRYNGYNGDITRFPWYGDNVKQYKQLDSENDQWDGVIERVTKDLQVWLDKRIAA